MLTVIRRFDTAIGYKVEWEKELRRREQLGITDLPEPLPHPDDVVIDFNRGTAAIVGPATKEEKAEYDWFMSRRDEFEEELRGLLARREATDDPQLATMLDDEIGQTRRILEIIDGRLPVWRGLRSTFGEE